MSVSDILYPYLIDKGYILSPDDLEGLDYGHKYIRTILRDNMRHCDNIYRIKLELGTGSGGTKNGMKEIYGRTDLEYIYYLDILSFYPKIFNKLNDLFEYDVTELEGAKKGVFTSWANERIHSDGFRDYFLDKLGTSEEVSKEDLYYV